MDPFTDVLAALDTANTSATNVLLWLEEWVGQGTPEEVLYRVSEVGTTACEEARRTACELACLPRLLR